MEGYKLPGCKEKALPSLVLSSRLRLRRRGGALLSFLPLFGRAVDA